MTGNEKGDILFIVKREEINDMWNMQWYTKDGKLEYRDCLSLFWIGEYVDKLLAEGCDNIQIVKVD